MDSELDTKIEAICALVEDLNHLITEAAEAGAEVHIHQPLSKGRPIGPVSVAVRETNTERTPQA